MKIKVILIVLFIAGLKSYSQNFNGGFIGGLNATQISGDQLGGYNKLGLHLGGFVNLQTGKYSSLQMELAFNQKGSRSRFGIGDTTTENRLIYRLRLNYIELPFIFKYDLKGLLKRGSDSTNRILKRLGLEAGLSYATLLSSSEVDLVYGASLNDLPFKKYELNALIGIYYTLNDKLTVSFRRTGSLLPVRKHSGGGTYRLNMGQYNDVVEFTLHYQFNKTSSK